MLTTAELWTLAKTLFRKFAPWLALAAAIVAMVGMIAWVAIL